MDKAKLAEKWVTNKINEPKIIKKVPEITKQDAESLIARSNLASKWISDKIKLK